MNVMLLGHQLKDRDETKTELLRTFILDGDRHSSQIIHLKN